MTEQQARSLVAGAALVICAVIAAIAWGQGAVLAVIVLGQVWLLMGPASPQDGAGATNRASGHTETVGRHRATEKATQGVGHERGN